MRGIKRFQRKIEDFICLNCGTKVKGGGYTDHCPQCLFSKHMDKNPGDRAAGCNGIMEPLGVETKAGEYIINYKCRQCGLTHRVKAAPDDNFERILKLAGH